MNYLRIAIITLFVSLTIPTLAQTGSLTGKVTDAISQLALPGATIVFEDAALTTGTTSDNEGIFRITNIAEGEHLISVSYIGYEEYTATLIVTENKTTVLNITLQPGVVMGSEVVVIGEALKGQARALNQQKNGLNITNIVAADQIGRFPDANVGDAMKRIPGITIQNDQGEARFGLIRGTAARLNSVMINGERVPSAEAENREVQLDLIPSDMIQAIEVNKTITPDMDADAIGGAVNLVTRSAPADFRLSATAGSGWNTLRGAPMGIGSIVVADRVANDKLGIVVSGSIFSHQLGSDNFEPEWDLDDNDMPFANELEVRKYIVDRTRRSLSASLDYKINPNHTVWLKGIYNHRDDWENRYRVRYRDIYQDANGDWYAEEVVREAKGGLDSDRIKNARLEDQRTQNYAIGGDHTFGKVLVNWTANYATASESRPNERYISYKGEEVLLNYDISDTEFPKITAQSPIAFNAFEFDELTEETQYTEDVDFNSRLDITIPGIKGKYANTIKLGGRLRTKTKLRDNNFFEYSPLDPQFDTYASLPDNALSNETDEDYLAGDYAVGTFVDNVFLGQLDLTDENQFEEEDLVDEYVPGNFNAAENILAGYAMITQNVGETLTGIFGIRVEHTNIDYTGNQLVFDDEGDVVPGETSSFSNTSSYTNILPGLHLNFRPNNNSVLRFAWTNTLARPNYFDLVPYRQVNFEDNELFEGNPALEPTLSMNFDMIGEYYFSNVGLLSGGVFLKDIDNFIYVQQFQDYTDPLTGQEFDIYFQPRNGGTATLFGLELAIQRQLDFLPGILKRLNVYANYTYTQSSADGITNEDGEPRENLPLPGTANHMLNASLSYESDKFQARIAMNYASDYIDELGGEDFFDRYYDQQLFVDANASYQITKTLRFFVEANNLTNQPLRYFQGIPGRTMQAEYYGPRFQGGLKLDLQ